MFFSIGVFSIFTRIISVIRSPFAKSDHEPSTSSKHKLGKNKYSEFQPLDNDETTTEASEQIYTITDTTIIRDQLPWSKSKELQTWKASKSKVIAQKSLEKDLTPKEVAKLRKSKSNQQQQDGKNNWKCCLF